MRIAVAVTGRARGWARRLQSGLPGYELTLVDVERGVRPQHGSRAARARWGGGRRWRRHCLEAYEALLHTLAEASGPVPEAAAGEQRERFREALYALADAAREGGGLGPVLRPAEAVRVLEAVGPGGAYPEANLQDAFRSAELLADCLRPLETCRLGLDGDWSRVDVWHAVGGGRTVLPGLLAHRAYGTPLVVTEFESSLRQALDAARSYRRPVRALPLTFLRLLAGEAYAAAGVVTAGSDFTRRWQVQCGAEAARLRLVPEGSAAVDEERPPAGPEPERPTLAWQGRIGAGAGLETLLRAFAQVLEAVPGAALRLYDTGGRPDLGYGLALHQFAGELGVLAEDEPFLVSSGPAGPADALGSVLVLPEPDRTAPGELAEAMLTGRAVVATDVGVTRELLGPCGLLVPPGSAEALAGACVALLGDGERRARLGLSGRLRAQERCSVQAAVEAFGEIYLDQVSQASAYPEPSARAGEPRLFARPVEYWLSGQDHALRSRSDRSAEAAQLVGVAASEAEGA